ncbi:MAG TPA: hypothetical protein VLV78_07485 [Thermoanaerobaculia bacterium]|nr:hypothetical protein [Thermoanaerobaculia bacterium]
MLLRALRFVMGAAVAFAIWWYATPAYDDLLCELLQQFGVHAVAVDRIVRVARIGAPDIQVPADQLTYNFVLFIALAAAVPTRKVWRLLVALIVLLAIHPFALAVTIETTWATRAGPWSAAHYSSLEQQFWTSIDFLYRLGGMFGIAFVCWYSATYGAREPQPGTAKKSPRGGRARR